ncbi:XYL2 [Candida oxycetoniae]|uniref:XYL2 n=1 Tax=Candida oxycetoniae TaxID=497107 RepID=A0AAI9X0F5_9ASCO|nr:XYL2 [Candida oxycetoniae]KAI3406985.1 XYL2 [Candida oxycetoniae]
MPGNPSLVLRKVDDIVFEDLAPPKITSPNDVIVEVKKTGICGSDIHYYAHGKIGPFQLKKPMVLGHESSGVISEIGDGVKNLKVGDRVAIEPGVPSRYSNAYKSGKYEIDPDMSFAATPPADPNVPNPPGTLCKYFKSPQDFVYKLPDCVSLELGAMVEPLSVGVHGIRLANLSFGENVVVFGAGPVGLLTASAAKIFGALNVMVVDIFDSKLDLAKEIGAANYTFNSKSGGGNASALIKAFDGIRPDIVLECTGAAPCIKLAVEVVRDGGKVVQIGNASGDVPFPIAEFSTRQLTLFGSFRYGYGDYATSIKILEQNYGQGKDKIQIDFEKLITNVYSWEEAIKAYDTVRAGKGTVKCIINGPE